jgi:transposase InsO family protein
LPNPGKDPGETTIQTQKAIDTIKKIKRYRPGPKVIIDLCCGNCSVAQYYLEHDPQALIIAIDKYLTKEEALYFIPRHMHHRIRFIQDDIRNYTAEKLKGLTKLWGLEEKHLYHIHWSPDCSTYSMASELKTENRYRNRDGSVNEKANEHKQAKALKHDNIFRNTLEQLKMLQKTVKDILITVENPVGHLAKLMQQTLEDKNWQLLETDYCIVADKRIDTDMWTKKPTNILCCSIPSNYKLPKCETNCRYRFPEGSGLEHLHRQVICLTNDTHPEQTKQEGQMRHMIPRGLFKKLKEAHEDHLTKELHNKISKSALKISTCIECDSSYSIHEITSLSKEKKIQNNRSRKHKKHTMSEANATEQTGEIEKNEHTTTVKDTRAARQQNKDRREKRRKHSEKQWKAIHAKYGHASLDRIDKRTEKIKFSCPVCDAAKACRKAHKGKLPRATYAMQRVHTDVQGPFRVADLDGNKYQSVFVDCFTRRKWIYLMKDRAEYGKVFLQFLAEVGVPPEKCRSDFGGEYLGQKVNQFLQICLERGIQPEKSIPRSPQQNAVAERSNRTLLTMTRALLLNANLEKKYWGYAMKHAAYLDTRLKSRDTNKTPYEAWHGEKHDDTDLITFGAKLTFRHHDEDKEIDPKLDMPGHEGIFLGYCPETDGMYVQDLTRETKPVRITRDIIKQSIDERHITTHNSTLMSEDDWQLTEKETENANTDHSEPLINTDTQETPIHKLKYWKAYQTFAQEYRTSHKNETTPEKMENKIKQLWKAKEIATMEGERQARQIEQQYREAVKTQKANNTDTPSQSGKRKTGNPTHTQRTVIPMGEKQNIEDTPCEKCKQKTCTAKNDMLICDGCDRGYHQKCYKIAKMPLADDQWYCYECLRIGMQISKLRNNGEWETGVLTHKYSEEKGVDIEYMNGSREQTNLYHERWRPDVHEDPLYHITQLGIMPPHKAKNTNGTTRPLPARDDDMIEDLYAHLDEEEVMQMINHLEQHECPKTYGDIQRKCTKDMKKKWENSMEKEWKGIVSKKAVKLVPIHEMPKGAHVVPSKWVYRIKACGTLKSRLCVLGNKLPRELTHAETTARKIAMGELRPLSEENQHTTTETHTHNEEVNVSSPTPRMSTVRTMLDISAKEDMDISLVDVEQAFMWAPCRRNVYINLPPGLNESKTHKALIMLNLYGTVEAPRLWHDMLHGWLTSKGYKQNTHDPCLYTDWSTSKPTHVLVWVDDVLVTGTQHAREKFKSELRKDFTISDLGTMGKTDTGKTKMTRYLGLNIEKHTWGYKITQDELINNLLQKCKTHFPNLKNCDVPITAQKQVVENQTEEQQKEWQKKPYRNYLGAIGYIMLASRPDLAYAYHALSKFNHNYGEQQWKTLENLLGYIQKTKNSLSMHISKSGGSRIMGYTDSDWNGDHKQHSTTGWIIFKGKNPISWCSKSQKCTARSTAEAEYIGISSCTQEAVYLQMLMKSIKQEDGSAEIIVDEPNMSEADKEKPIYETMANAATIWSDSQSAICNSKDPWISNKLRHIKTAYHFFKQFVEEKIVKIAYCPGKTNHADIFTKGYGDSKTGVTQVEPTFHHHARTVLGMPIVYAKYNNSGGTAERKKNNEN